MDERGSELSRNLRGREGIVESRDLLQDVEQLSGIALRLYDASR